MTQQETQQEKKKKKLLIWLIAGGAALILLILLLVFLFRPRGEVYEETVVPEQVTPSVSKLPGEDGMPPDGEAPSKEDAEAPAVPQYPEVRFPVEVIGGKLTVNSVFQFTGPNPDNGGEPGSNLAAIQVKNISDRHLTAADITLTLTDKSRVTFRVKDLPAGKSALVLSADNKTMDTHSVFMKARSKATFEEKTPLAADFVTYTVNGRMIEVHNKTQQPLKHVTVYCHHILGEDSFGGLTYAYQIDEIPAGESRTVDAVDCFQGSPEVVRIAME